MGTGKTLVPEIRKKQFKFLEHIMRKDSLKNLILTRCDEEARGRRKQ